MAEALLHLLTWLSPAFPTGGFAYSHGLEQAIEAGDIKTAARLRDWLDDLLRFGAGRNDAILLRHAYHAEGDALAAVAAIAAATAPSRERHAETLNQGTAFALAATPWLTPALGARFAAIGPIAHPVALGALAAAHGIGEEPTVIAWLHAWAANLVSAGVRLIPLGQSAGLAVQAALESSILEIAGQTRYTPLGDIGGCSLRADIAAMRHETQYTRLFRS